ncbi:hypothetical protein LVD15_01950 [Fulvivirga maritima]|uniref:hypothetical protein n=1 Tax=Fulvivirga maritima TaxID=2904247 RepID=UPI001F374CD6|nr:hypothetical protein [Fulvivirga maritima]UII27213.1 hypothetical protein LVD15_01950 [Fulvivirga maritima]
MKKFAFTLVIVALHIYVGLPTFYIGFHGVPFLILLILGSLYGWRVYLRSNSSSYEASEGRNYLAITFFTYLAIYLITVGASTMSLFRSGDYQEQIGEVKIAKDLEEHMAPISTEEIIIVDKSIAYRLGDKVIGADPSLGSQTELGDFTLQKINDKLYWVAPLLHSGFFKWFNHKEGTPGYIRVSATNERDVELIQSYDGKPIRLKYQTQAFSLSNLARHVYFNGYMNKGLTDFSFETDDKGRPYWVVTIYDNEVGFAGQEATGVLTVDPESGEITEYTIEDAPKWVDRIQPDDFVITQLNNWG